MESSIFSIRLNELLQQKKIKQIDLVHMAEERGIKLGKSHISQYVSGKTVPRKEILHFLADVLSVKPEWLLGKSDAMPNKSNTKENKPEKFNLNDKKECNRMREFKKSSKLENVLYDVRGPVVEEAARMENEGTQVLKLNIGNPAPFGFRTPFLQFIHERIVLVKKAFVVVFVFFKCHLSFLLQFHQ